MPTYHNAGGVYPNLSAPARQAKLDSNQNHHHTIPSTITNLSLLHNTTQHSNSSNLTASNISSHPVSPIMTTHSNITSQNVTSHINALPTPVIITSNSTNSGNTNVLPTNPRHEVKLNAMPYVLFWFVYNFIISGWPRKFEPYRSNSLFPRAGNVILSKNQNNRVEA